MMSSEDSLRDAKRNVLPFMFGLGVSDFQHARCIRKDTADSINGDLPRLCNLGGRVMALGFNRRDCGRLHVITLDCLGFSLAHPRLRGEPHAGAA
jgi:hypothetical protein